jgi:hypothetical protein
LNPQPFLQGDDESQLKNLGYGHDAERPHPSQCVKKIEKTKWEKWLHDVEGPPTRSLLLFWGYKLFWQGVSFEVMLLRFCFCLIKT